MNTNFVLILLIISAISFLAGNYYYLAKESTDKEKKPPKRAAFSNALKDKKAQKQYERELNNLFLYDGTMQE